MSNRPQQQNQPQPVLKNKDPPNKNNPTWKTYARIAAKTLISPEKLAQEQQTREGTPSSVSDSMWAPHASHYRPFKRGIEEHTVIYDVTECKISPANFFRLLSSQLTEEQNLGAEYHKENSRVLLEIVCDSDNTCSELVKSGVHYENEHIFPFKSLDQEADIVFVRLSKLPFIPKLQLQEGLKDIFSNYGQVLDVLLLTDTTSGFFFGNGLSIINRTPPAGSPNGSKVSPYLPLTHTIDFFGKKQFYCTWKDMPSFCQYCHETDHLKATCPHKPVIKCWSCGNLGHFKYQCPSRNTYDKNKRSKHIHLVDDNSSDLEGEELPDVELTKLSEEAEQAYYAQQEDLQAMPYPQGQVEKQHSIVPQQHPSVCTTLSSHLSNDFDDFDNSNQNQDDMEVDPETPEHTTARTLVVEQIPTGPSSTASSGQKPSTTKIPKTKGKSKKLVTSRTTSANPTVSKRYNLRSHDNQEETTTDTPSVDGAGASGERHASPHH